MTEYYLEAHDLDMKNKVLKPSKDMFKDKLVFVMVMAEWCGHCQRTKPEFKKATKMSNDEFILCLADITGELDSEKDLSNKTSFFKGFRGFPHLACFKNGVEVKPYNGGRTAEDMLKFLNECK